MWLNETHVNAQRHIVVNWSHVNVIIIPDSRLVSSVQYLKSWWSSNVDKHNDWQARVWSWCGARSWCGIWGLGLGLAQSILVSATRTQRERKIQLKWGLLIEQQGVLVKWICSSCSKTIVMYCVECNIVCLIRMLGDFWLLHQMKETFVVLQSSSCVIRYRLHALLKNMKTPQARVCSFPSLVDLRTCDK